MQNTFYRFEFKYPTKRIFVPCIEDDLLKIGFERDLTNSTAEYDVSSIYFDSPTLLDYFEKLGGFLERKKLRARIYGKELGSCPFVFLEIKKKHDMMIHKERMPITHEEWNLLLRSPQSALRSVLPRLSGKEKKIFLKIIYLITSQNRKPYVLVQYKRKAFQLKRAGQRIRITLDSDIRAEKTAFFRTLPSTVVNNNFTITELKFSGKLPLQVKLLLSKYNLFRDAYSKYAQSVDNMRVYYPISH